MIHSPSTLHNISIYSHWIRNINFFLFLFLFSIAKVCANFEDKESSEAVATASNQSQSPSFGPQTPSLPSLDATPVIIQPLLRNNQVSIRLEQSSLKVSVGNSTTPFIQKSNKTVTTQQFPPPPLVVIPVASISSNSREKSNNQIVFFPSTKQSENRSNSSTEKLATKKMVNFVVQSVKMPSKNTKIVAGQSQPNTQSTKRKAENSTADGNLNSKQKVLNKRTAAKLLKCNDCDYSTVYATTFKRHLRTHTDERPHRCEICESTFTERTSLNRHMKMHGQLFPYQCSNCRQGFSHQHLLHFHEKNCTTKQFECYLCEKKFHAYHVNLKVHMRRKHTGERPYSCPRCQQTFCQTSHLTRHTKICLNATSPMSVAHVPFFASKFSKNRN